jgi:hypothetical protein
MRQNRVAGAEVVDGNLDADVLELREGLARGFDVVDHRALGDLQTYRSAVDAELFDGVRNAANKAAGDQLNRRHIDPQYGALSYPVGSPAAEFGAGAAHHPSAQVPCKVARFSYADE